MASTTRIRNLNGRTPVVVTTRTVKEPSTKNSEFQATFDAIGRSQAVVEFMMDGTITHANADFLLWTG